MSYTHKNTLKRACDIVRDRLYKNIDIIYELEFVGRQFNKIGINMNITTGGCDNGDVLFVTFEKNNFNPVYSIEKILQHFNSDNPYYILDKNKFMLFPSSGGGLRLYVDGKVAYTGYIGAIEEYMDDHNIEFDQYTIRKNKNRDPYYTIPLIHCVNKYVIYSHTVDFDENHPVCLDLLFYSDLVQYLNAVLNNIDDYKEGNIKYKLEHKNLIN